MDVKKGDDLSFPMVATLFETSDNSKREETVKRHSVRSVIGGRSFDESKHFPNSECERSSEESSHQYFYHKRLSVYATSNIQDHY